ncbi:MAG: polyprenyl synthetase family protein [Myxococcota bacterium]|nr:polyprenyl synthetase family protein [Myxococcota bacterium]
MNTLLSTWSAPRRTRVDALLLSRFAAASPDRLAQACQYPLSTGGKRIRALLSIAACEALRSPIRQDTLLAAAAVEMVHGYSLVHDDLPCMDNDDERRGRPTVHRVYTEGEALLVGDAMLTEAFSMLCETTPTLIGPLVAELSSAAGHRGMIGGQAFDVGMAGPVTDVDTLLTLHRGKTGALIRAAVRMGGRVAGAEGSTLDALTRYGEAVGLAFQLADDVLDEEQDAGEGGPPSFIKLLGAEQTRARAEALAAEAEEAVAGLPAPEILIALARYTVERDH